MNNEPLKIGDIAYVYRGCIHCGNIDDLGEIIKVHEIVEGHSIIECCDQEETSAVAFYDDGSIGKYLWCLRKIPPLEELNEIEANQEITA